MNNASVNGTRYGPPFDVVFFDCDSTLSAVEGIDELARRAGVYQTVAPLTEAAMDGSMTLDEVYAERLRLIQPDRAAIDWLAKRYIATLVPEVPETLRRLYAAGKQVHIVSGGLRDALIPLASLLQISNEAVHAVPLRFDETGGYSGYDTESPLARKGGKAQVCANVLHVGQRAALVGDGSTDLEAAMAGVYVVGFGGVARRQKVEAEADVYVPGPGMLPVLQVLLTPEERAAMHVE